MSSSSSASFRLRQEQEHGQIQVIFGPMFSGKTTELMRRMKRFQIAKYRCLIIKYAKDTRYDENGIATHDNQVLAAVGADTLSEIQSQALHYDIIGIDEGQFFPDVVPFSDKMAEQGKIIIVAALDGTYQKKGFGSILDLVPLAESVVKLSAVCMNCFKEGSFTKRIASSESLIEIGGADKYMAVCRQCYISPRKTPQSPLKDSNKENIGESNTSSRDLRKTLTPVESAMKRLF